VIELHPHTAFTEEPVPDWTEGGDPRTWEPTPKFELQPVSDEDMIKFSTEEMEARLRAVTEECRRLRLALGDED
jgi:hypothetical protein